MPPLQTQGWHSPLHLAWSCICICQAASLLKLSSGHLCGASLSSAHRSFLRRDPHGSAKQIHDKEVEVGDKERCSAFPKIMLEQTDSGIQQLHGAGERT